MNVFSFFFSPFFPAVAVDGDPHFVVDFPLSQLTVCFNIDGEPGDILRLVSDHMDSGKFCPPSWPLGKGKVSIMSPSVPKMDRRGMYRCSMSIVDD